VRWRRRLRALAAPLAAALGLAGCGHGSHARPAASGPCSAAARGAIAGAARTAPRLVTAGAFLAPSGAPSCRFHVGPGPIGVVASIDGAPQAYARFERTVVEYGQNVIWSHRGPAPYPRRVPGLGLDADWLPVDGRLLTTDGTRLVDITVTGASAAMARQVAEALARRYVAAGG
jgi:hypothetical protein